MVICACLFCPALVCGQVGYGLHPSPFDQTPQRGKSDEPRATLPCYPELAGCVRTWAHSENRGAKWPLNAPEPVCGHSTQSINVQDMRRDNSQQSLMMI